MKLMYIDKAVLKYNNSQPWQANQKTQIVRDACMHQVLQPNLIIVLGGKKASYNMLISFTPGWPSPVFFVLFLVCVVKIEPRNH
jgi:hypothetical protein